MRLRWVIPLALLLLAASALAGIAQPRPGRSAATPGSTTPVRTITVNGHGAVTTVPDRASFAFTVETRATSASAALARTADAAAAVAAAVKKAGVAASDVQTSQVSLSPQLNENGTGVVGYVASDTVTTGMAIARAGAVVDAAVDAGATGVSGPSLSRADADELSRDALKKAVGNAHDKAAALAAAAGLTLGDAQSIVEGGSETPIPFARAAGDASLPIEPGTQTVDATVTVTYEAG